MSVVWARDSDCNEWGDAFRPFSRRQPDQCDRHAIPDVVSNKDGYSGNPTSFIDVNDPRVADAQRKHEERNKDGFRKNMSLVAALIQKGVVMPTDKMILKSVEKLKKIASGQT